MQFGRKPKAFESRSRDQGRRVGAYQWQTSLRPAMTRIIMTRSPKAGQSTGEHPECLMTIADRRGWAGSERVDGGAQVGARAGPHGLGTDAWK